MKKKIFFFILISNLFLSVYAERKDPTRPPNAMMEFGGKFISPWQLDAIIIAQYRRIAIINGQIIPLGGNIEGNKLILIAPDRVQLQGIDGKMTLFLQDSSFRMY